MINVSQELIVKQNNKEKELLDQYIEKRGFPVIVKPPTLLDNGVPIPKSLDDFNINIPTVSMKDDYVNTRTYDEVNEVETFLILEDGSFGESKPITSDEIMAYLLGEKTDTDTANNFTDLYAYIKSDIILTNGTIVQFKDFINMDFIIKSATKKKQLSKIFRYKLGRT